MNSAASARRAALNGRWIWIGNAVGSVLGNSSVEEVDVLAHQTDRTRRSCSCRSSIGRPSRKIRPPGARKSAKAVHHRALAGAGGPDDADRCPGRHHQIEALQQRSPPRVSEIHLLKANLPTHQPSVQRGLAAPDRDRGVDQIQHPLGGSHGPLVLIKRAAEGRERPQQALGDEHQHAVGANVHLHS